MLVKRAALVLDEVPQIRPAGIWSRNESRGMSQRWTRREKRFQQETGSDETHECTFDESSGFQRRISAAP